MVFLLRALFNLYQLLTWPLWALLRRVRRGPRWVELELHGAIEELASSPPHGVRGLLARLRPTPLTVAELRALGDRLASEKHVEGLLVVVRGLRAGWVTLSAARTALARLAESGKRIVVLLPEGGSQQELFVASAGSHVAAPPSATFNLLGPAASRHYVAPLLSKLGLRVDVIAQGRYKTAAEALVRDSMSEAEREQSDALIATLKSTLTAGLETRLSSRTGEAFERALFDCEGARALGLVDQAAYRDELETSLGLDEKHRPRDLRSFMRQTRPRRFKPLRSPRRFAVLQLTGPIGDLSSARSIGLKATSQALQHLIEQRNVAGVVLYIDSPGGSATVSDLLHHEVQRLAKHKPVVAWMGNVAASGGYYLAAGAARIVAQDCTLTGSIGVISAHLVAADLLGRLGIHSEVVKHTPHADLASITRPLDETERALLDAQSRGFYARFLQVVAEGRRISVERAGELGQGRVWSGRDAHTVGLVDVLGGYVEARNELRTLLGDAAAGVAWEEPLVMRPRPERGGLWGGVGGLASVLAPEARLHPSALLAELAFRHGPMLTYAPDLDG